MDRKPDMSRTSWSSGWSKNLSYLDNISKYDLEWHTSKVNTYIFVGTFFPIN